MTVLTTTANCAALRVHGCPSFSCRLKLIADGGDGCLPPVTVHLSGKELPGSETRPGEQEYAIPGGSDIEIRW